MPSKFGNAPIAGAIRTVESTTTVSAYSGPTPPVEILEGYERLAPGSAKAILDQFVKQSNHRINLEDKVITSDIWRSWAGLFSGCFLATLLIAGGTYAVLQGHDTAGASIATTAVAAVATVFVKGSQSRQREREAKAKLMRGGSKPQ